VEGQDNPDPRSKEIKMAIVFELAQNNGSSLILSHVEPGERDADEVLRINAYGNDSDDNPTDVTVEYDLETARLLHEHLGRIIEAAQKEER
jgi:hypothetical protein